MPVTTPPRALDGARRSDALDGLRTFAVAAVILFHAASRLGQGGVIGVDVFFVVSGFVITRLIVRELDTTGTVALGRFYLLRLARLWPALAAVSVFTLVMEHTVSSTRFGDPWSPFYASFYVTDFVNAFGPITANTPLNHTWSLAVEEQFYLLWPLVLLLLIRRLSRPGAALATLGLCGLALAGRVVMWTAGSGSVPIYYLPITRADQLLIGCAMALLLSAQSPSRAGRALQVFSGRAAWPAFAALILTALLLPAENMPTWLAPVYFTVGMSVVALLAAIVVFAVITNEQGSLARFLSHRVLSWPGRHLSYSLYLWHYPIGALATALLPPIPVPLVGWLIVVVITVPIAWLSSRFLEEPVRLWAKRSLESRRPIGIPVTGESSRTAG